MPDRTYTEKVAPDFAPALVGFDPGMLADQRDTIYGLRPDLSLAYLGRGWFRFAEENGGEPSIRRQWTLDRSLLEAIPPPLRSWYEEAYRACLASGQRFEHDYECSTPESFRLLHQIAYPLADGAGLLLVHSAVALRPHDPVDRPAHEPDDGAYHDPGGFVHQCCHCRRVERQDRPHQWDWVPSWVSRPPRETSDVLCPLCMDYYYPQDGD